MTKQMLLVSMAASTVMGHGYLTKPLPRQYREEGIAGIGWTNWMGITVPGDASFNPGEGNAPNLNAGIGGGVGGMERELNEGHGLCGDIGSRNGFTSGIYGATPARGTYSGTLDVKAKLTAYHAGWFEFRLCNPGPGGVVTQDCLNEHVLEVDSSTPYYPEILDYDGMHGIGANDDGGWYKCQTTGGHFDPLSNTPNTVWPSGSCCNGGGACSPPSTNTDRYVVEFAGEGGVREYDIVLKLPNIECDNCVLQWMYQTANSRETYPESFWNCADIAVTPFGPSNPTPAPASPTNSPPTNSPASPTTAPPTSSPPTSSEPSNPECGDCQGCWWTATSTAQGCYDWSKATCDGYGSAYVWCSGSGSNPTPAPASPTNAPPTNSPPASPTPAPPTSSPPTSAEPSNPECGDCQGCWWTATSTAQGCYGWSKATCDGYGSAYVWCSGSGSNPTPAPASPTNAPPTNAPPTSSPQTGGKGSAAGWQRVMTPEIIAAGHPWGISSFGPNGVGGLDAAKIIFDDISTALEEGPAEFAAFCNSGDDEADRREAAAFLANVIKETGGYSAFTEVSPHGTYCTWNGEGGSDLQAAGESFPCGAPFADQGYANEFIGRGAIQLTWNINYGRFSEFYFGDQDVLLKNPEIVEGDGPLGWAASLWFWMTPQDFGGQCPPKQLDSDMPLGHMSCHQSMQEAGGGMGQTIRIINGGYEACPTSSYRSSATARLEYYLGLTSLLNVPSADTPGCQVNDVSLCDISGMDEYLHTEGTIGNPLIGMQSSAGCERCQVAVCTSETVSKWLGLPNDPVSKLEWTCN